MERVTDIFLELFNMTVNASYIIILLILLRLIFKRVPRKYICAMWLIAAIRLVCPFSLRSILSLLPSAEVAQPQIIYSAAPQIHSGITFIDSRVNPVIRESLAPSPAEAINPMQLLTDVMGGIWLAGFIALCIYTIVSFIRMKLRLCDAVKTDGNIYQSDKVSGPFIFGVIKPKIYIPFDIDECTSEYVLAHERAHIKRLDHIFKPLGFFILCVHWFNPLVWVAYALFCRDIEIACDQSVMKNFEEKDKEGYAKALLLCAIGRKGFSVISCPLAFGEVSIKERIKNVMNYKKPAFWVIVLAIIAAAVVAVCFLTSPEHKELPDTSGDKPTATTPSATDQNDTEDIFVPKNSLTASLRRLELSDNYGDLFDYFIDEDYFKSFNGFYNHIVIRTNDEFEEFLENTGLDSSDITYYDYEFFNENMLAIAGIYEGSGSIHHAVSDAYIMDNNLQFTIDAYTPEICTDDIQFYLLAAELKKEDFEDIKNISFLRTTKPATYYAESPEYLQMAVRTVYTSIFPDYCYANWNEDGINLMWSESVADKAHSELPVVMIKSKDEFEEFYLKVEPFFTLDYEYTTQVHDKYVTFSPSATLESVRDNIQREGFFDDYTMFIVHIPENSTSIYHSADPIYTFGDTMYFNIKAFVPEAYDTAMSGWFMCYSVRNDFLEGITSFISLKGEVPYISVRYEAENDSLNSAGLELWLSDNQYHLYPSILSSYISDGYFTYDGDTLILTDSISGAVYRFKTDGDSYIFEAEYSSPIDIPDGAVFS